MDDDVLDGIFFVQMAVCVKYQHFNIYFLQSLFSVDNSIVKNLQTGAFPAKG